MNGNLTPPVTWLDVTNPPTLLGGLITVTNTTFGGAQLFRLRKPQVTCEASIFLVVNLSYSRRPG